MRNLVIFMVAAAMLTGCSTSRMGTKVGLPPDYSGAKRIEKAVEMLPKNSPAAVQELKAISASTEPGVTDEALFRLALLSLKPSAQRPASRRGSQLLNRLKKEYPTSPWTAQAAPLIQLIRVAEELRRQNRDLKAANRSLSRENETLTNENIELVNIIEDLKELDLGLQQNAR